jgi:succinyl-CoA synthetase beta subunit
VDLLEYQARDLFERFAVPVLSGRVASTADEAVDAYEQLGAEVAVIRPRCASAGAARRVA